MHNADDVLRNEFSAQGGSFLLQLRHDFYWDKVAYRRLTEAMLVYAKHVSGDSPLDRWAAQGFWFTELFTRSHTAHPNFPRPEPPEYYAAALRRLEDLCKYLFDGESPYDGETGFHPL